jgi:hypothetical protein
MARIITARLEDDLEERYNAAEEAAPEENKSAVLRSVVADGLDAKDRDVLEAIEASDELREAVEARREEGEPLDDAARRLLREGAQASGERDRTPKTRALVVLGVTLVVGTVAVAYVVGGVAPAVGMFVVWALAFAFDDVVVRGVAGVLEATNAAGELADELEAAREERPDVEERDRADAVEEEPT